MNRLLLGLLTLPLCFVACASVPRMDVSVLSGSIPAGSGAVSWTRTITPAGAFGITLQNNSTAPATVFFSVPTQGVGTQTTYEKRQTGVRDVEYCDPVTQECYTIREPTYELVPVDETVYADLDVEPRRLTLSPGASAIVTVVQAPGQSDMVYVASIMIRVGRSTKGRRLVAIDFVDAL